MKTLNINGKEIFICEKHNEVLFLWEKYRSVKPYLISFDHHTDTHPAFQHKSYHEKLNSNQQLIERLKNGENELIHDLINDEHIDAAIKCEFINKALLFTVDSTNPKRDDIINISDYENYSDTSKIIINHNLCCHTEISIESKILEDEFKRFEFCIMPEVWKKNYILDIDLDFFHYKSSIEVNDYSFFNELIKNAKAITIARETIWIEQWKRDYDKNLTVEFLEKKILEIIQEATKI
ncbi:peptide arginase family protein [Wenyingzhuangia sp. IMCC45467]